MPILRRATLNSKTALTTQLFKSIRDRVEAALGQDKEDEMMNKLSKEVSDLKDLVISKQEQSIEKKVTFEAQELIETDKDLIVSVTREKDGSKTVDVKDKTVDNTVSCIFCGDTNTEEHMEYHYLHECRLLSTCPL